MNPEDEEVFRLATEPVQVAANMANQNARLQKRFLEQATQMCLDRAQIELQIALEERALVASAQPAVKEEILSQVPDRAALKRSNKMTQHTDEPDAPENEQRPQTEDLSAPVGVADDAPEVDQQVDCLQSGKRARFILFEMCPEPVLVKSSFVMPAGIVMKT